MTAIPSDSAAVLAAGISGEEVERRRLNDVAAYVVARGLLPAGVAAVAQRLVGGVSGEVVLVHGGGARVVVKRALARLDVADTWLAKPERALTEAAALAVLGPLVPDRTPTVLDVDVDALTFTMSAAPSHWRPWKQILLDGVASDAEIERTGAALGALLGVWHRRTWRDATLAARFDDYEALEQLRVTPFHRAVAQAHPQVADVVLRCAAQVLQERECLVHGDYSPKNVLVGPDGLWVLDCEVAHVGAAVFDVAFLQCHLMLKAIHVPQRAEVMRAAAVAAHRAYTAETPADSVHSAGSASFVGSAGYASFVGSTESASVGVGPATHIATLLLARVDGRSPAGYLTEREAEQVRRVALQALHRPERSVHVLWESVVSAAASGSAT